MSKKKPPGISPTDPPTNMKPAEHQRVQYSTRREKSQALSALVVSFIPTGREHAVTLRHVQAISGINARTIRAAIREARLAGTPVVSDYSSGTWISEQPGEIRHSARALRHMGLETVEAANALDRIADKLEANERAVTP